MSASKNLPDTPCPICEGPLKANLRDARNDDLLVPCDNCGQHVFSRHALVNARRLLDDSDVRAAVAHAVWRRPEGDAIDAAQLESMANTAKLPQPLHRLDLLVVLLATTVRPGRAMINAPKRLKAKLGCETPEGVQWVISQALAQGLVIEENFPDLCLSAQGWKRFAEIERSGSRGKVAFMAMAYGPGPTEVLYASGKLHQAIDDTGFRLTRVDGEQADAKLIDVRMQVELRTCRFVVCDLSDHNRGAYWEAGFATGIGRPVFYLCRADVAQAPPGIGGPHFDTNHYPIIPWEPADPEPALRRLKDMIRATLPEEATMVDKPRGAPD